LALGAKTATGVKLRGQFCSFFLLGSQNRNFGKVRGLKLLLSLDIMQKEYRIKPSLKHYGCMVNLLGKAGYLEKAYKL